MVKIRPTIAGCIGVYAAANPFLTWHQVVLLYGVLLTTFFTVKSREPGDFQKQIDDLKTAIGIKQVTRR